MFEKILRKFEKIYLKIEKKLQNLGQLCKYTAVLKHFQYVLNACKTILKIFKKLSKNLTNF